MLGLASAGVASQSDNAEATTIAELTNIRGRVLRAEDVSFAPPREMGAPRDASAKLAEQASVLDFDVDPKGRNDSSAGFAAALRELGGGALLLPKGVYLVEGIGALAYAGQKIIGESRWNTVLRSERGAAPILFNEAAARGTAAFHLLSDFQIDLNGTDSIGIDLASVNASSIERIHFRGGADARNRQGTGVRFAAPLQKGAYDNALYQCSFENLRRAVMWDSGANNNAVFNCRVSNCVTAYDAAPAGGVDTPRIFGGRIESCDVGVREGASYGAYYGVRFEGSKVADMVFFNGSKGPQVLGGFTADSTKTLVDLALAESPVIDSSELGYYAIEENNARPKITTGRQIFGASGKAPDVHPDRDYAAYFANHILIARHSALEFIGKDAADRVIGMTFDENDGLSILGLNRNDGSLSSINLGGGTAVRPLEDGVTDLGSIRRQYRELHVSEGVAVEGKKVLSSRQAAIRTDDSGAINARAVNQILDVLRAHGLIEHSEDS